MRRAALLLAALLLPTFAAGQEWRGPAALEVQVEDAKGRNLAGAEILLIYLSPEGGGSLPTVLTDANGRANIGGLAAGRWTVEVRHAGHMSFRAELALSADGKPLVQSASHRMAPGATSTMKIKFSRGRGGAPAPAAPAPAPPAEIVPVKPPPPIAVVAEVAPAPAPVPAPLAPEAPKAPVKDSPPAAPVALAPTPVPAPAAAKAPVKELPPAAPVAPVPVPEPAPTAAKAPPRELPPAAPVAPAPPPGPTPAAAKAPVKELSPAASVAPVPPPVAAPAVAETPVGDVAPVVKPAPAPAQPPTVAPAALPAETPPPAPTPAIAPAVAPPPAPAAALLPAAPAPARGRLCVECPAGESAAWGEAAIEGGATVGCPVDLPARLKSVDLVAAGALSAELAAAGTGCRVIAVELPAGARFTGFRYEAQSAGVTADCLPGRGCPAGGCRFPNEPVLRVEGNRTVLLVGFESTAPDLRRAVVAGYSTYNKR